ncbi:54S ribosomal protein RML2 mitochondrial [Ceratocystis platani]|uniref:Large ribosomal subunit protein uL2m n=1 Tax=Ceratocystis fimbriata f. sp. platani TaxID=88771 RepID=A0A0F8DK65_CERFI|nr:54S ribosomal protein RML2 mitochondrial [Ceratocystis platani]
MIAPRVSFALGQLGRFMSPARSPALARFYSAASTVQQTPAPEVQAPPEKTAASGQQPTKEGVFMRTYKPTSPGIRHLKRPINDHLWKGRAYLPLTFPKKGHGKGGRNNTGRVTVRHRGGGVKRRIRIVDFDRCRPGPHTVDRIEHDPGRSAHIALITEKATGRKSYIVAAEGMRAGDVVQSYRSGIPQDLLDEMGGVIDPGILAAKTTFRGNCLPVHLIPVGTMVYCIGSFAKGPAKFCRSAGTYATLVSKEEETREDGTKVMTGKYVNVQLQSGEIRRWITLTVVVVAKGGYKTRHKKFNKWVVTPRVRNMGKRRDKASDA